MSYSPSLPDMLNFITNDINRLVAEDIIVLDPMFSLIPWIGINGNTFQVNREDDLAGAAFVDVNEAIPAGAKSPATFEPETFSLKSVIADAMINGQVKATSMAGGEDVVGRQIRAKAKALGQMIRQGLATGTGIGAYQMNSLRSQSIASQSIDADGEVFSLELLDEAILKARSSANPDYILLSQAGYLAFKKLMRGFSGNDAVLIGGRPVMTYANIPVFLNEFLSEKETALGVEDVAGTQYSIYVGQVDDGTEANGLAILYPNATPAGLSTEFVGISDTYDAEIYRLKAYINAGVLNRRGIARVYNINKTASG
jgi:hypothetical protein